MTTENFHSGPTEYPGKDYAIAASELEKVNAQIEDVAGHYDAEISAHDEVRGLVTEGDEYPYEDERKELVGSRDSELLPLTQKQRELKAKLQRFHTVAWNEAHTKEEIDRRREEHKAVLPAVMEMHQEIHHISLEIDAFNKRATGIVRDAEDVASQLEVLLSKEVSSDEDEKMIRTLTESLVEVYGKITSMEHAIVHSAPSGVNE